MDISSLPKIELHLHLDCSLSYEVVSQIDPDISLETYQRQFLVPFDCANLDEYLEVAQHGVRLLQTKEALELAVQGLVKELLADGVIYAEVRFAPLLHTRGELKPTEAAYTVVKAMYEACRDEDIEVGVILATLRHFTEKQSLDTAKIASFLYKAGVVGFDLAGDEKGFPIARHRAAFEFARLAGIPCTAHAGEACGAPSVRETIRELGVKRIGHGVRSIEDPQLLDELLAQGIHLEVCPTSNLRTKIAANLSQHPIQQLYDHQLSLSINTDARAMLGLSLNKEYQQLSDVLGWKKAHFCRCNLAAVEHAFVEEDFRAALKQRILTAYQ